MHSESDPEARAELRRVEGQQAVRQEKPLRPLDYVVMT
jgi:hypothetical protein